MPKSQSEMMQCNLWRETFVSRQARIELQTYQLSETTLFNKHQKTWFTASILIISKRDCSVFLHDRRRTGLRLRDTNRLNHHFYRPPKNPGFTHLQLRPFLSILEPLCKSMKTEQRHEHIKTQLIVSWISNLKHIMTKIKGCMQSNLTRLSKPECEKNKKPVLLWLSILLRNDLHETLQRLRQRLIHGVEVHGQAICHEPASEQRINRIHMVKMYVMYWI